MYIKKKIDLVKPSRSDHVKLHVTLMNSKFSVRQDTVNDDSYNRSNTFDAKKILEVRL